MINIDRIKDFNRPVLFWSAGKDSTLLLTMLYDAGIDFDIVQLGREHWSREQKRFADELIRDWDLKVLTFPPAKVSFIGDGNEISAVFEYAMGGSAIPVLRDVIPGTKCIADLEGMRLDQAPMKWDCAIVGSKFSDRHHAVDSLIPGEEWKVGDVTFLAPLADWEDIDVEAALLAIDLIVPSGDDENTGNLPLCRICLDAIEGEVFCPLEQAPIPAAGMYLESNLKMFRKQFVH